MTDGNDSLDPDAIVPLPITSELDLHTFRPADLGTLVPEYLAECRSRGILEVRVVHGKGRGQLLRSVHALLARLPWVEAFALATPAFGGPGATFVRLKPTGGGRSSVDGGTSTAEPPGPGP